MCGSNANETSQSAFTCDRHCTWTYPLRILHAWSHVSACTRQVVFVGLDVVVPLITEDLLKIPKLCRLYFGLLGYMLEAFPERMAALPGADSP